MTDDRLRELYREHLGSRPSTGREGCPAPDEIAAALDRRGREADRLQLMNHVMGCPACQREFELLRALGRPQPARRSIVSPLVGMAAAILILVAGAALIWTNARRPDAGADVLRDAGRLEAVSPAAGTLVQGTTRFTWRSWPGGERYQVSVFTADGETVLERETTDTTIVLEVPSGRPAGDLFWQVTAEGATGTLAQSAPVRLRAAAP